MAVLFLEVTTSLSTYYVTIYRSEFCTHLILLTRIKEGEDVMDNGKRKPGEKILTVVWTCLVEYGLHL